MANTDEQNIDPETGEAKEENIKFFDMKGLSTGQPIDRKVGIQLIIMVLIYVGVRLLPLDHISPTASSALALVATVVWVWVTDCMSLAAGCLLLAVVGMMSGLFDFGQFSAAFSSSPFIPMIGMLIVSMGASRTKIARRVAYIFLSTLGRSPAYILLALCTATAIVSAFVSNLGTTIVMSSISIAILESLGEEKGTSGLGKAIMLGIPIFSMIGGIALITGSPSTNMMGISMLESATDGAYTITYAQWAKVGVVTAIAIVIPTWLIYKNAFGVTNQAADGKEIDVAVFKKKLDDLGPFRGAELRWTLIVILMVVTMASGILNMPTAALLCALLTIAPIIGVVDPKEALSSLPMDVLMLIGFSPIIADLMNESQIGEWLVTNAFSWANGLPPFVLMLILTLAMTIMINLFANATIGIIGVVIVAFTPMVMANGLNPAIVLMPAMFMGSATTVLGVQTNVVLTYHYGYWDMKDPIKPGIATSIAWSIIACIVAYFVGPMIGMPIHI